MHQHPRSPARTPSFPTRPGSVRADDQRGQDFGSNSHSSDTRANSLRNPGVEAGTESVDYAQRNTVPAKEAVAKLNQIISNYHTKAALLILLSRVDLPPSFAKGSETPRINRWFNVEVEDTDVLREQLRTWRTCGATENRPPPLVIETFLDSTALTHNQSLVILDGNGKRWDVEESLNRARANPDEIILERWRIELGEPSNRLPADLGSILPTVYKKSIVLFRSLFTYSKFLPAWKFTKRHGKLRAAPALKIRYRILDGYTLDRRTSEPDNLAVPLYECNGKVVDTYSFGVTESPAGPFSVDVTYRTNCDFRVDDSEALLSSRFMGADDEVFRPSIPSGDLTGSPNPEIGSLPSGKRMVEYPDRTRAYGSLSTFHQVGPTMAASPISALRAARDSSATSISPSSASPSRRLPPAPRVGPIGRPASLVGDGGSAVARRPSTSFQPFKAPPLSASPSLVDSPFAPPPRTISGRPLMGTSYDPKSMHPPAMTSSSRRTQEHEIASSNSASPKPAPISKYSSSFSHRRGRPSSGSANRVEDDNSSGRASATSSAQPGSGLLADATGTSADSIHADDENISDFLKLLDQRKDLLNPTDLEASTRRTSAALNRFQRMRESNAALSDSMSSSLLLQRSSNSSSKQLSGVPPMVAGTSFSTSSSPGKAMSPHTPHTPHTPAIPSRLSSNSIIEYSEGRERNRRRLSQEEHEPPLEENTTDNTTMERIPSAAIAIDIPNSPRPIPYRRSSSAAQHRRIAAADDDEIFPFGMRSVSLGAEERSHLSLSALLRRQEYERASANADNQRGEGRPSSLNDDLAVPSSSLSGPDRETVARRGTIAAAPSATLSSNHHLYQPRFAHSRGRGSSGGPHSLSSASSSLARGAAIPPHMTERDPDRDGVGSGSNSATSATETRRGSGQRSSSGRALPSQATPFEEEEPLLFAMSDFGVSRRSLEEGRYGHAITYGPEALLSLEGV
ncbi:autophagy protein 13 [Monascus purpureus]|uniref:Autophagy-related protein 13 n=1 Tax=Monascus purpureus TaxID=5098 RepID=A0A507R1R4_MONPU|nr:autophagy protein 13 [Monascus purpureus]